MSEVVLFILLGLGLGALIAGLGLGLVLSYRGSGSINIAIGAVAMLGAYTFYTLRTEGNLVVPPFPFAPKMISLGGPWATAPAFLMALLVCAVAGVIFDLVVLRKVRGSSPLAKLLVSLGLFLVLQSIAILRFGTSGQAAPKVLPEGPGDVVHVFGQTIPSSRFVLAAIVIVAAALLAAAYRYTRFGLSTRAAAEDESKAMLAGLAPNALSVANTVLAFTLAGALGVLVAPMTLLDPTTIALSVIPALAAALFARFTSFSVVTAAGLAMGAITSLVTYFSSKPWFPSYSGVPIPGVTELVFFLIIVVAMFLRGAKLPERGSLSEIRLPAAPRPPRIVAPAVGLATIATIGLLVLPYGLRQGEINSLIGIIVCLSFVVITGYVGQISMVQVGLAGIAAFGVSHLSEQLGLGFPIGPLIAVIGAMAVGILIAVSALRVRGVQLAIVTLAAAVALQQFVFANPLVDNEHAGIVPNLLGLDLSPRASFPINAATPPSPVFGLLCVLTVVLVGVGVACIRRSVLGQRMLAVRSNERAAAAVGIDVRVVKVTAVAISSAIAGIAGVLYAYDFGVASPNSFGIVVALNFVAFAYLGGISTVSGAVIGGLLASEGFAIVLGNELFGIPVAYQELVAGVLLIQTIMFNPSGIAGTITSIYKRQSRSVLDRLAGARKGSRPSDATPAVGP